MKSRLSATDIDKIETEAIVLLFFSNERPLKGATGLIDWRMNGSISRLIKGGRISGENGESTLILPTKRIKAKKILMAGLGDSSTFSKEVLKEAAVIIIRQLDRIGVRKFTIALPPAIQTSLSKPEAATALVEQMVETIEKEKINGSHIFTTIALEKEFITEAKVAVDNLRKSMRGIETA